MMAFNITISPISVCVFEIEVANLACKCTQLFEYFFFLCFNNFFVALISFVHFQNRLPFPYALSFIVVVLY